MASVCEPEQVGLIEGGLVFDGNGFSPATLRIDGDRISDLLPPEEQDVQRGPAVGAVVDARGCYVIPGLLDLHFHGCVGSDFSDGDIAGLHSIAAYQASVGVTAICPASMTLPHDTLRRAFACAASFEAAANEAALVGINMEGPYISPNKVGAQNPQFVRAADAEEFRQLQEAAGGLIKIVDIAPEEAGASEFIDALAGDVRISVAHTCADYECARGAFAHGALHVTHLYNAMPGLHHRNPGPIAAATENPEVTAELIADGIHVHPAMVRLAFEMFGRERVILISDSLRACGLTDGIYELGGQNFKLEGRRATLPDGTLAGSATHLMGCLKTAVLEMKVPLEDAVLAASANPARALGVEAERGHLEKGAVADAVVLDGDLEIKAVVLRGKRVR